MVRAAKFRREHVEASEFTVKPLKTGRKKDSGQEVRPGPGRHATKSKSRRPKANVCYHCGSSEHLSFECSEEHDFRFARCLRCRQCGHFAHDCPEDANQVLKSAPVEGPCEFCSSIEHSSKECRPLQLVPGKMTVGKISVAHSADDDDAFITLQKIQEQKSRKGKASSVPKVIVFK